MHCVLPDKITKTKNQRTKNKHETQTKCRDAIFCVLPNKTRNAKHLQNEGYSYNIFLSKSILGNYKINVRVIQI